MCTFLEFATEGLRDECIEDGSSIPTSSDDDIYTTVTLTTYVDLPPPTDTTTPDSDTSDVLMTTISDITSSVVDIIGPDPTSFITRTTPKADSEKPPVTSTIASASEPSANNTGTSSPSTGHGLSTGAKAGIGAGVGVVALVILGILLFFWRRRGARAGADGGSRGKAAPSVPRPDMAELEEGGKFELHGTSKSASDMVGSTTMTKSLPTELDSYGINKGNGNIALGLPAELAGADHGDAHQPNTMADSDIQDHIQTPILVSQAHSSQDQWSPTRSSYVVSELRESLVSSPAGRDSDYGERPSPSRSSPDPLAQRASLNEQLERLRERKRRILDLQELEREEANLERRISEL